MYFHCTKALLDKLKIASSSLTPIEECDDGAEGFYSWHANIIPIGRRKAVVFMNNRTRYLIVLYGMKAQDWKKIEQLFREGLYTALKVEGFTDEIINTYLENCGEVQYAKTAGRQMVGFLNQAREAVEIHCEYLYEDSVIQDRISLFAGKYICNFGESGYGYPIEMMGRALSTMVNRPEEEWRNLRRVERYQLMVRLNLEKHDVWRRITIPSRASFRQLHEVIQKIYDWHDVHLHNFYPMKNVQKPALGAHIDENEPILLIVEDADSEDMLFLEPGRYEVFDERDILLSEVFQAYSTCIYTYDLGDGWEHMITLEKVISDGEHTNAILLDGKGKRPPEDVGGEDGFEEYLQIVADENHPDYEDMIEWASVQKERDCTIDEINRELKLMD